MRKVHITLLGKETLPSYYLAKSFDSDKVYIVSTPQTRDYAQTLKAVFNEQKKPKRINSEIITCNDAFDINTIIGLFEQLHKREGAECEMVYNVTGGTKPMAVGAFIVAQAHQATVLYTNSDSCVNLTTRTTRPLNIEVDTKTIFKLYGKNIQAYSVYTEDTDKLQCAKSVMSFLNNTKNRCLFSKLHKMYVNGELGKEYRDKQVCYSHDNGHLKIGHGDTPLLDLTCPTSRELIFEGRWWELLVAQAVHEWATNKGYELWQNVTFKAKTDDTVSQEIDLLFNTGTKPVFIECKSGSVTQNDINKIGSIRQSYGSDKAKSVLISYEPVRDELRKKAKDGKIDVIAGTKDERGKRSPLDTANIPARLEQIILSIKA